MVIDKIKKRETPNLKKTANIDIPVGKWIKCEKCKEIIYKDDVRENYNICPSCGQYFRMHVNRRIELVVDEGTFENFNLKIETPNPLEIEDYPQKLSSLREKTGLFEAVTCGKGKINGEEAVICVMDSGFLMGSMGVVVGERITQAIEKRLNIDFQL